MLNLIIPLVTANCSGPHCNGGNTMMKRTMKSTGISPVLGSAVSEPLRSCTDGFMYDHEHDCCFMDIVTDPMFSCLKVGGTLEGDRCKCHRTKIVSCMEGYRYNPDRDTCDRASVVPMVPSCSHIPYAELTDDGRNCISDKVVPARKRCPRGTKLVNNVCVSHVLVPDAIMYSCPDGWMAIGQGTCEMQEEVTCEHEDIQKCKSSSCGFEKFKACKNPCKVVKKNRRNLALCDKKLGLCELPIDPEVVCQASDCMMEYGAEYVQDREVSVKTTCTRTTHMNARRECRQGQMNRKGDCCVPEYSEPLLDCPRDSIMHNGECVTKVHALSDFLCPSGYTVDCGIKKMAKAHPAKCECVAKESVPAIRECPMGTYPTPDGMCEMYSPADIYCADEGFVLGQDGMCLGREHEPVRLEYTVTYVKQKECMLDVCQEKAFKSNVQHTSIYKKNGVNMTQCDIDPCVDVSGRVINRRNMEDEKE